MKMVQTPHDFKSNRTLAEIHDCLTLALDATERRTAYSRAEREARGYIRAALTATERLLEVL